MSRSVLKKQGSQRAALPKSGSGSSVGRNQRQESSELAGGFREVFLEVLPTGGENRVQGPGHVALGRSLPLPQL